MGCLKFRKKFTIKSAAATFKVANVVCYTCKKCFLKRVAGFPLKCDENRKSEIKFKETYEGAKLNWNDEPDDRANEPTLIFEFGKTLRLEKRYFLFQIELEYTFGNAQSDESRDEGSLRFIRSVSKVKSRRDRKNPRMKPEIWGLSRLAHISILAYCRFYVWCNMTDDTIQDCFNGKVNESGLAIVGLLKII